MAALGAVRVCTVACEVEPGGLPALHGSGMLGGKSRGTACTTRSTARVAQLRRAAALGNKLPSKLDAHGFSVYPDAKELSV